MKLSIIIPVYQVEKYVKKCVSSLLIPNRNDYELIIINDGTKDRSIEIVEQSFSDSRIRIIHQKMQVFLQLVIVVSEQPRGFIFGFSILMIGPRLIVYLRFWIFLTVRLMYFVLSRIFVIMKITEGRKRLMI